MRLSAKMALCMLLVLGVLFALCGYTLIGASFQSALDDAARQSTALHAQQKLLLLRALCAAREESESGVLEDYHFITAAEQAALRENPDMACAVVTKGYASLYSTLPAELGKAQQAAMVAARGEYSLLRLGEKTYFTMASAVCMPEREVYLLNTFDVTALFVRRGEQTSLFWKLYAGMMLAAAAVCTLVAAWLTRPVARLNRAAKAVAAGAYGERVAGPRRHGDEIDELSHSFDAMAQAVQEKVARLEVSVRQREDFMGAFTHELKTPMTAMMGYAALLQRDDITPQMREKALCYLHSETKRLEALSQKLLMLLGLSEEDMVLVRVPVQTLFNAVQAALPEDTTRNNPVHLTVRPGTPDAVGDTDLLVDLLRNLIENAVRASGEGAAVEVQACGVEMPQDGADDTDGAAGASSADRAAKKDSTAPIAFQNVSHAVTAFATDAALPNSFSTETSYDNGAMLHGGILSATRSTMSSACQVSAPCAAQAAPKDTPKAAVRISVCDSGCGIPEAELARVTEPFYSVDKSRSRAQGGSGLGLSICERIARLHGASLRLFNRPQGGTEAVFVLHAVLPDNDGDDTSVAPQQAQASSCTASPAQSTKKEDDAHA